MERYHPPSRKGHIRWGKKSVFAYSVSVLAIMHSVIISHIITQTFSWLNAPCLSSLELIKPDQPNQKWSSWNRILSSRGEQYQRGMSLRKSSDLQCYCKLCLTILSHFFKVLCACGRCKNWFIFLSRLIYLFKQILTEHIFYVRHCARAWLTTVYIREVYEGERLNNNASIQFNSRE